jgi:hypothetical protein
MRSLVIGAVLFVLGLGSAYGQVGEESLSGLKEVQVVVQSLGLEESSLTEREIQVEVELALREAGIGVYSDPEDVEGAASPVLIVTVYLQQVRRLGYTYVTDLELEQSVLLANNEAARGVTYEVGAAQGRAPMDKGSDAVLSSVETSVRTFINDWVSVH